MDRQRRRHLHDPRAGGELRRQQEHRRQPQHPHPPHGQPRRLRVLQIFSKLFFFYFFFLSVV